MISYAVIPAAGLATRVAPAGKAIPKELFPIPHRVGGRVFLYPVIHAIFDSLYEVGIRNFCIVISPRKRILVEYFTPDMDYVKFLENGGKVDEAKILKRFYDRLEDCNIEFAIQDRPKGVGDAIYRAWHYVSDNDFIINMGDMLLIWQKENPYKKLIEVFYEYKADAAILVKYVDEPRHYGVIIGDKIDNNIFNIKKIIEKPTEKISNLAVLGVYCVKPYLFRVMEEMNKVGPWELPDSVQRLAEIGKRVVAYRVGDEVGKYDVGRVETYLDIFKKYL
jgi:UTP--glucose-1-phosphate uridylyltransferase